MDYRKHTNERYEQRFKKILSDSDYVRMSQLLNIQDAHKLSKNVFKELIYFDKKYIWCIFNRKYTIFTVLYPKKKDIKLSAK
jgi:hypothetical protein